MPSPKLQAKQVSFPDSPKMRILTVGNAGKSVPRLVNGVIVGLESNDADVNDPNDNIEMNEAVDINTIEPSESVSSQNESITASAVYPREQRLEALLDKRNVLGRGEVNSKGGPNYLSLGRMHRDMAKRKPQRREEEANFKETHGSVQIEVNQHNQIVALGSTPPFFEKDSLEQNSSSHLGEPSCRVGSHKVNEIDAPTFLIQTSTRRNGDVIVSGGASSSGANPMNLDANCFNSNNLRADFVRADTKWVLRTNIPKMNSSNQLNQTDDSGYDADLGHDSELESDLSEWEGGGSPCS
jgi:hypothetical protein